MIIREDGRKFTVIDCHTHLGEGAVMTRFGMDRAFYGEQIIKNMDKAGVDGVCAFSLGAPHTDYSVQTQRILGDQTKFPNRIYAFARINPLFEDRNINLMREYITKGLRGIKFHPKYDGAYPINDRILIYPLMEEINQHKLIVMIHSGEVTCATPALIAELAKDFPNVPFIIAHFGMYGYHLEALAVAKRLENIYLDTSFLYPPAVIKMAVKNIGKERVLMGTDHPVVPFGLEIDKIMKYSSLEDDEIAAVLGENIKRLLEKGR